MEDSDFEAEDGSDVSSGGSDYSNSGSEDSLPTASESEGDEGLLQNFSSKPIAMLCSLLSVLN